MAKKAKDKDLERLRALIEEATIDCYGEHEEYTGLLTMIQDNVVCPFEAKVVGEEVEVIEFQDVVDGFGIRAVCKRDGKTYLVDVGSLEWLKKKPEGYEWIEAYFHWRTTL